MNRIVTWKLVESSTLAVSSVQVYSVQWMCVIKLEAVYSTQCNLNDMFNVSMECVLVYIIIPFSFDLARYPVHSHSLFSIVHFIFLPLTRWQLKSWWTFKVADALIKPQCMHIYVSYSVLCTTSCNAYSPMFPLSFDRLNAIDGESICYTLVLPHKFHFVVSTKSPLFMLVYC